MKLIQAVQSLLVAPEVTSPTAEIQNLFDSHGLDTLEQNVQSKVFFEDIKVNQGDLNLSLVVTGKIDEDLSNIKKNLGLYTFDFKSFSFVY